MGSLLCDDHGNAVRRAPGLLPKPPIFCYETDANFSSGVASADVSPEGSEVRDVTVIVEGDDRATVTDGVGGVGHRNAGDRAPECVNAVPEKGFVQVYNNCPFDVRVKVIFAFGLDSACKLVVAGTRTNISVDKGSIDGVQTC